MSDEFESIEIPIEDFHAPKIEFTLNGPMKSLDMEGVLDTGFTGFLQIPFLSAIEYNLMLHSIGQSIIANGQTCETINCLGQILFHGRLIAGIINTSGGTTPLLGMKFIEALRARVEFDSIKQKMVITLPKLS